jgi:hypothetical protein
MKKSFSILLLANFMGACFLSASLMGCQAVSPPMSYPDAVGPVPFNPQKMDYQNAFTLIIQPKCIRCHGQATEQKGDVTLDTYKDIQFYLLNPDMGDLIEMMEKNKMPPRNKRTGAPAGLPERQRLFLLQWLKAGAPMDSDN